MEIEGSLLDPDAVPNLERLLPAEECASRVVQQLRHSGLLAAIEAIFVSEARDWPSIADGLLAQLKVAGSDEFDDEQAAVAAATLCECVGMVAQPRRLSDRESVASIARRLAPPLIAAMLRDRGWREDHANRTATTIVDRYRFDSDPVEADRVR